MEAEEKKPADDFSRSKLKLALLDQGIEQYLKKDIFQTDVRNAGSVYVNVTNTDDVVLGPDPKLIFIWDDRVQSTNRMLDDIVKLNDYILSKANYSLENLVEQRQTLTENLKKERSIEPVKDADNNSVRLNKAHLDMIDLALKIKREEQTLNNPDFERQVVIDVDKAADFYDKIVDQVVQVVVAVEKFMSTNFKGKEGQYLDEIASKQFNLESNYSLDQLLQAREKLAEELNNR